MQSLVDKINDFLNSLLGKMGPKPTYEELGENLIKEDFSQKGILNSDSIFIPTDISTTKTESQPAEIAVPSPDIYEAKKTESANQSAREKFLSQIQAGRTTQSTTINPLPAQVFRVDTKSQTGSVLKGVAYTFGGVLLLMLTYFIFIYAESYFNRSVDVQTGSFVYENDLVRGDSSRAVGMESGVAREVIKNNLLQTLYNEDLKIDQLVIITPTYLRESTQTDGKKAFLSETMRGDDFFFSFAPSAPLAMRTISANKYALGATNASGKMEGFIAIEVSEKSAGLRELLRYEPFIYQDMKDTLKLRDLIGEAVFKNITINNHELRALTDNEGVVMVYGFAGNKVVVFTSSVDAFEQVFQRLK